VAAASPAADDVFSIAAAFTDPGLTDPALSDPALTDRALTDRAAADEPSESESERAAGAGSGAAGGGVARPWGAAVVDDADGDDGDEDDVDETAATGPDEDAEAAAAIHGLDGEAIVVLEPNADLVSAGFVTPMGSDAAPKADDLQRESAAAAPADDAEEPAIGSRIEPVEGRGDEAADAAPPIDERVDAGGDDAADAEPVVAIPRPAEGVRQQRLFVTTVDEGLVREAVELVTSTRRASVALLQRKLQIDFEQAMEVLAVLARRGVIDLAAGETQGRVR
jgi:DNA segregation ATPase FtsK/SpoIIIE-like protein